jgi:hypothetical protein
MSCLPGRISQITMAAPNSDFQPCSDGLVTTVALVSIAFCFVATELVMVRRATPTVDLNALTVNRQLLTQHHLNGRT